MSFFVLFTRGSLLPSWVAQLPQHSWHVLPWTRPLAFPLALWRTIGMENELINEGTWPNTKKPLSISSVGQMNTKSGAVDRIPIAVLPLCAHFPFEWVFYCGINGPHTCTFFLGVHIIMSAHALSSFNQDLFIYIYKSIYMPPYHKTS